MMPVSSLEPSLELSDEGLEDWDMAVRNRS
jgi:hypothetical protein